MALPANLQTVTVTGTYIGFDGVALSGTVRFEPNAILSDAAVGVVILPKPFVATLDNNGSFSVSLPATNDPDISPVGFSYKVTESLSAGSRRYFIQVPFDTVGNLDISALAPIGESVGVSLLAHNALVGVTQDQHHPQDHDDTHHTGAARINVADEGVVVSTRSQLNFTGAGVTASDDAGGLQTTISIPGGAPPGYGTIQDEGTPLTQQSVLDFAGAGVTATNDGAGGRTLVTIPGGGSSNYQTVQDEGTGLTQRPTFNFVGAGVLASDDAGNNRTNVTITGGGGVTVNPGPYAVVTPGATVIATRCSDGTVLSSNSDAATVINAAIASAGGLPDGGRVMLAHGLFTLQNKLIIPAGNQVELVGNGGGLDRANMQGIGTILQAGSSFPAAGNLIEVGANGTSTPGALLSNFAVDVNHKNANGIKLMDALHAMLERVLVINADTTGRFGVWLDGTLVANTGGGQWIDKCYIRGCDTGLRVEGTGATDGFLTNSRINSCKQNADVWLGGWQIMGNHITGDGTTTLYDLYLQGATCSISGNFFDAVSPNQYCLWLKSTKNNVTGNYFKVGNGSGAGAHCIRLEFQRNIIMGNTFETEGGPFAKLTVTSPTTGIIFGNGGTGPTNGVVQNSAGSPIANGTSGTNLIIDKNFVV